MVNPYPLSLHSGKPLNPALLNNNNNTNSGRPRRLGILVLENTVMHQLITDYCQHTLGQMQKI